MCTSPSIKTISSKHICYYKQFTTGAQALLFLSNTNSTTTFGFSKIFTRIKQQRLWCLPHLLGCVQAWWYRMKKWPPGVDWSHEDWGSSASSSVLCASTSAGTGRTRRQTHSKGGKIMHFHTCVHYQASVLLYCIVHFYMYVCIYGTDTMCKSRTQ